MGDDPDVKWRRSRVQSLGLLTLAIALAVLSVLVDKWDGPSWLMVGLALCAAGGGVGLEWRKDRAAAQDEQATVLSTSSQPDLGAEGRFRTVGETGWDEFRVQPAAVEVRYIPRDVQQELHDRLVEGRPVLVVGHSMAGKTRMAYEVVRELYYDWPVWIPERPDGLARLMTSGVPQQTVVWLDDLETFLTSDQQLRLSWLAQLESAGCRVVATIRASEYEKFQPVGEVKPPQWDVVQRFALVRLFDDQDEQNRIAATVEDEPTSTGIRRYGIAEYVGGGYRALDKFQNGQAAHPLAVAMLRAAADWRRLGFDSIPTSTMSGLAPAYLSNKLQTSPGEDATSALEWASTAFGGHIRLLEPAGDDLWRVFDYILDYLTKEGRPVPEVTWTTAAEAARLNPRRAYILGYRAYRDDRYDLAIVLSKSAAAFIPEAALILGAMRMERREFEAAATAYQQALDTGDPDVKAIAAFGLGVVRAEQGDLDGATAAYQQAINTNHPDMAAAATLYLGILRRRQGDPAGAATAFQQAIDTNQPDVMPQAMVNLGVLRAEQGDLAGAATAYQQAINTNHPNEMPEAALHRPPRPRTSGGSRPRTAAPRAGRPRRRSHRLPASHGHRQF
jgi:tetratricopeptide (TPR) repeat protein